MEAELRPTTGRRLGAQESLGVSTLEPGRRPPPMPRGRRISIRVLLLDDTEEVFEVSEAAPWTWSSAIPLQLHFTSLIITLYPLPSPYLSCLDPAINISLPLNKTSSLSPFHLLCPVLYHAFRILTSFPPYHCSRQPTLFLPHFLYPWIAYVHCHCPRKRTCPAPWQSDVLLINQRKLRAAGRKWKKSQLDTDLSSYCTLLSKFSSDVTAASTRRN
uniref:FERM, ARH/RhoGEF and pleckstrin domain protein 1 n=1 Tax=Paramormyrops kingsleyae TaxID=1676925 RepID=A0A3B3SIH6_9TELE